MFAFVACGAAYAGDGVPPLPSIPGLASGVAVPVASGSVGMPSPGPLMSTGTRARGAFDLRFASVGQVVDLVYADALHVPHVISDDVLEDRRLVSFQFDSSKGDLRSFVLAFLDSLGFEVVTRDGVDFVGKKGVDPVKPDALEPFVYRPKHRSASYLAKLVQPLFSRVSVASDSGSASGAVQGAGGGAALPSVGASGMSAGSVGSGSMAAGYGGAVGLGSMGAPSAGSLSSQTAVGADDELVVFGRHSEMANVRKVVEALDSAPGQVVVRGWVYEVSLTDSDNSGWSVAAHVLDGQLGIGAGNVSADANAFSFDAHFLKAAISALSSDSRFREVSDPHVRVVSGQKVSLNVGSQVPTLGSVSYQGTSGTPVQSVDYQDAGVLFSVQPTVMGDAIDLSIDEEISSFVATTTGVNGSPTKNTRSMTTTVQLSDGEVVVLGGLVQDTTTSSTDRQRWLPRFMDGSSSSKGRTEVLLVLQVQKV
ncbi:MAG TPA: type II secretory pathway protein [Paraburkholderia sp.]|jgi:hypothetical protein|nr:type II secretory pathway protein [Paraburkholderia sp.]